MDKDKLEFFFTMMLPLFFLGTLIFLSAERLSPGELPREYIYWEEESSTVTSLAAPSAEPVPVSGRNYFLPAADLLTDSFFPAAGFLLKAAGFNFIQAFRFVQAASILETARQYLIQNLYRI